jgi:hypothetical protein
MLADVVPEEMNIIALAAAQSQTLDGARALEALQLAATILGRVIIERLDLQLGRFAANRRLLTTTNGEF